MEQKRYYCAACGKTYDTIEERATCELKCSAERKKAEEAKKKEAHEAARKASEENIYKALSDINEMLAKHFEEYHTLSIEKNYPYLNYIFKKSPFWF